MEKKKSVGMYVVWLSPSGRGGLQAYPGDAEVCPSFPPSQAALRIIFGNREIIGPKWPWYEISQSANAVLTASVDC